MFNHSIIQLGLEQYLSLDRLMGKSTAYPRLSQQPYEFPMLIYPQITTVTSYIYCKSTSYRTYKPI